MHCSGLAVPHVVAIGASAGGLQALTAVLSGLPADLPAPILIVQHISRDFVSRMARILTAQSAYHVSDGREGEEITCGSAHIAPADRHMLVDETGRIRLRRTALIHFTRPSVDALFCSLAPVFKERVIAVLLSGSGFDGTEGARIVRTQGGTVIAQSQPTSEHFGMPGSAIGAGHVNYVLPLAEIPQRLIELTASIHG